MARSKGTELEIVAAEACVVGLLADGDGLHRVVRLPTADSLGDRMERGEAKSPARRRDGFQSPNFADVKARRILPSGRQEMKWGQPPIPEQMGSDLISRR